MSGVGFTGETPPPDRELAVPPTWRITGTFQLSMEVIAETPSGALEQLHDALDEYFEHHRVGEINLRQLDGGVEADGGS